MLVYAIFSLVNIPVATESICIYAYLRLFSNKVFLRQASHLVCIEHIRFFGVRSRKVLPSDTNLNKIGHDQLPCKYRKKCDSREILLLTTIFFDMWNSLKNNVFLL